MMTLILNHFTSADCENTENIHKQRPMAPKIILQFIFNQHTFSVSAKFALDFITSLLVLSHAHVRSFRFTIFSLNFKCSHCFYYDNDINGNSVSCCDEG